MIARPTIAAGRNSGRTLSTWVSVLAAAVILVFLVALILRARSRTAPAPQPLLVHCAAGLKVPVEAVARDYERSTGLRVELTFGGSQTLLANIALSGLGDIFIPADDSYIELAREKNLVTTVLPIAEMTAVLLMPKDQKMTSLSDLLKSDLTIAQANPDAAAIGKLVREKLPKATWEALRTRTAVFTATVTEAANAVKIGSVQAAFIWDAMAQQYPALKTVHLPELDPVKARVALATLKNSRQPETALRFAQFITAPDTGLQQFERNGFKIVGSR